MRVWTLACDDNRNGTYASVHLTERAAWENLVLLVTSEKDTTIRETAATFIEAEEYGELNESLKNECFDLNDTHNVDYDDLELPGTEGPLATATESSSGPVQVFNDRELATVLHALRCLQELRQNLVELRRTPDARSPSTTAVLARHQPLAITSRTLSL